MKKIQQFYPNNITTDSAFQAQCQLLSPVSAVSLRIMMQMEVVQRWQKMFVLGCVILPLTWGSGRPKGLSLGFRPKFSVSVSAKTFRQKLTFRPKEQFRQKWHISTQITFFRHLSAQFQNRNKLINGRNWPISAERMLFRSKCLLFGFFLLFRLVSAFGRNLSYLNELFRFRPKLFRSTTNLGRVHATYDNLFWPTL